MNDKINVKTEGNKILFYRNNDDDWFFGCRIESKADVQSVIKRQKFNPWFTTQLQNEFYDICKNLISESEKMNDKGQSNNKDVQTGSNIVTGALNGEIARLKDDLDRLHRERDSFQRQCSVMAEEMADWEAESKRLDWMIQNRGRIEWEFGGNCYVTFIWKNEFKSTLGSDDTRVEIDRAMEMCK